MNVILDIDETIVQFGHRDDIAMIPSEHREKYVLANEAEDGRAFILRPKFVEFFNELASVAKTINLWTLSDKDYANDVKGIIESLTRAKITNVWADTDNDEANEHYSGNKPLPYIWNNKYGMGPKDTILIDDLPQNTQNKWNLFNGFQIKAFAPLGEKVKTGKTKERIREGPYVNMSRDDVLLQVLEALKKIRPKKDVPFKYPVRIGGRRKTRRSGKQSKKKTRKHRARRHA